MTSPQTSSDLTEFLGAWVLDPAKTSIEFHTKAMWVLKVKGTAAAKEGEGSVGADGSLSGTLVIDAASIDTKNKKRDDHLRTADFLEVEKYPALTFKATGARPAGPGKFDVTGDLTIHGQTKPVTLSADVTASAGSASIAAETDIDRSDWGISWAKMGAGLTNRVVVRAHFDRA